MMSKLGWKIISLEPEEIDLTLFCQTLLESKLKFPIKSYLKQD
jgi:hypothetical protein